MAKGKRVSYLRGRRLRITELDTAGRPLFGDSSVVTTKGYVSVAYTTVTEEGEAITQANANGDTCVNEPAAPSFNGFGVEAVFCDVDFAAFEKLTGQPVVLNPDTGGIVGLDETTDVDLSAVNFALEVWTKASTSEALSEGSQGYFGYMLTPFLGGGIIGDVTVENAAINFTVTGMQTKNGSGWGAGPYPVELVAGAPALLSTPLPANSHRRIMHVEVAPPEDYAGSTPLLNPADPELTSITATPTGLSVDLEPMPAGPEPVWYDFGDGQWDYAETGSYTHVYDAAGTYTVTGRRGLSEITTEVTVATV